MELVALYCYNIVILVVNLACNYDAWVIFETQCVKATVSTSCGPHVVQ